MVKYSPQDRPQAALGTYLGGTCVDVGGTSIAIAVPSGANAALIHAETAAVYWDIGGTAAGTASPGFTAGDTHFFVPEVDNFGTVFPVFGAATAIAHVEFYQF